MPHIPGCDAAGTIAMGELDGADTERCRTLAGILADAGIKASVTPEIRGQIWAKLWGNASFSSIAVLTGSTVGGLATDPALVRHAVMCVSAKAAASTASTPSSMARMFRTGTMNVSAIVPGVDWPTSPIVGGSGGRSPGFGSGYGSARS